MKQSSLSRPMFLRWERGEWYEVPYLRIPHEIRALFDRGAQEITITLGGTVPDEKWKRGEHP